MSEKKLPPDFGGFILDADHGRINRILSNDLGRVVETVTDKSNLHETEWKGEITIKIKVTAEPNGKLTFNFGKTIKIDEEKLPKARMYYDPEDGALSNDVPRQVKIPGFDDDGRGRGKAKSAAAPKVGGNGGEN
jgi:hypothetical protein